jgi:hypothetical protein
MASREAGTGRSPVAEAETERRLASRGIERVLGGWWRAPPPPPVGIGGEDAVGEVDTTIPFIHREGREAAGLEVSREEREAVGGLGGEKGARVAAIYILYKYD